jgi:eukaryotic-like serine/threonine-protein kinase
MGDDLGAIPLFQRAVELDPNFAMAYARLGTVYSNLGQSEMSEQNRKKAFELRDRASEHEKLYITSHYYADSGQLDKGITALELYKQTYPRDSIPYNNLANIYNSLGQYENALDNARQSVQLDRDSFSGYVNLSLAYTGLNRLDEAKATLNQALQRKLGSSFLHLQLVAIALAQNDEAMADREFELAKAGPEGEMGGLMAKGGLAACRGQMRQARELGQKSREAAERLNLKEGAAYEYTQEALVEAIFLDKSRALDDVKQSLKMSDSPNVVLNAATTLAIAGEDKKASKLVDDVARQRPYDTLVQFVSVPLVKAQIEINHGNPAKAIDLLDGAMIYARVNTAVLYVRGNAYLRAGQGGEAVQAFQRMLDLRNVFPGDPLIPLAKLGLGRAYALQNDTAHSRIAYQDFLAQWKDADPDVRLLQQAKAEYGKVQ